MLVARGALVAVAAGALVSALPTTPVAAAVAEGVSNTNSANSTTGWIAQWSAGPVSLTRTGLATAAPNGATTAFAVKRGAGTGSWSFALGNLANPTTFFTVGKTYTLMLYVRDLRKAGSRVGALLANGHYASRPSGVSSYGGFTDGAWHKLSKNFTADHVGYPDTGFYVALPASGALDLQFTGASVQETSAPQPAKAPGASPSTTVSFTGAAGTAPSTAQWTHNVGAGINGWGNGEQQTYTTSTKNSRMDGNGHLLITALRETVTGPDGHTRNFTSARLTTKGKVSIAPGSYVEASIKAPTGVGPFSGFWLVGDNGQPWPASGEIDILESVGRDATIAHSAVHMAKAGSPTTDMQLGWGDAGGSVDLGQPLSATAHTYGLYFDGKTMRWYIDRKEIRALWASDVLATGRTWPFTSKQFVVLNVAIGGYSSIPATTFPATMTVGPIKVWSGGLPF